ncbi:DUF2017 domain-containing protein [Corynebacterium kutscheri]|uniref:Domain of uncharacterized function (DUF2017) n=1 Tax=Corynebacterium kutscheri TaxID=35755 RepID=A0AB38VSK0_9CORY|nr:DUF2017 domain-containing protein [Corynebacterium kutscheri]VEH06552.1 Domain of uncharacterised function (DUF2017) [Corynebacterium kutscheri]
MHAWKKKKSFMRGARYHCTLEPIEREILGNLAATIANALIARAQSAPKDELAELTGMPSGHKDGPTDAGLARLLPDFERDGDEEYEGDNSLLRSLHENDITRAKLNNLQVMINALGPDGSVNVELEEPDAHAWLAAINDIRLYLTASDIHGAESASEDRDNLVDWLGYNQESLLTAMMGELEL